LLRYQIAHVAMEWVPEGGNRKRGRLTKTWWKTFTEDLAAMEMPRMKPKKLRKIILDG